ncbi:tail fiber domain-containing protein [Azospirillum sp. B4]|uniref:tail fiber domain-containing protein n=1 Tax=Azospirillum sp. B4 TaxID=95605 RepID=UPI0009FC0ED6|nr:tail fiber domain-containing protein [Azospirillum sp. B4]
MPYRARIRRSSSLKFIGFLTILSGSAISGGALAGCPAWHVLQTGQTASATDVMDNFNHILGCPNFTGNVGIGTEAPSTPLEIAHNTGTGIEAPLLRLNSLDTQPNNGGSILWTNVSGANALAKVAGEDAGGYGGMLVFSTKAPAGGTAGDPVERLRIDSSGNVGIGTSSPVETLDVNGASVLGYAGGERMSIMGGSLGFNRKVATGAIYTSAAHAYQFQHTQSTTPASDYLAWQVYGPSGSGVTGTALTVNGLGYVGINGVSSGYNLFVNGSAGGLSAWTNLSDARLKKDIVPINGALRMISELRGVRFRWRGDDERTVGKDLKLPTATPQVGFIAQEVSAVLPEAVAQSADGDRIMSVQESKIVPVLVEAVRELKAQNQEYEDRIRTLEQESARYKSAYDAQLAKDRQVQKASVEVEERLRRLEKLANVKMTLTSSQ